MCQIAKQFLSANRSTTCPSCPGVLHTTACACSSSQVETLRLRDLFVSATYKQKEAKLNPWHWYQE